MQRAKQFSCRPAAICDLNLPATTAQRSHVPHLRLPWGKAAVVVESRRRLLSESV